MFQHYALSSNALTCALLRHGRGGPARAQGRGGEPGAGGGAGAPGPGAGARVCGPALQGLRAGLRPRLALGPIFVL